MFFTLTELPVTSFRRFVASLAIIASKFIIIAGDSSKGASAGYEGVLVEDVSVDALPSEIIDDLLRHSVIGRG